MPTPESEMFKAYKPKVAPTFDGVDYKDHEAYQAAHDAIIREQWVGVMMGRLVRAELGKCYFREGVNHLEKCGHLRGEFWGGGCRALLGGTQEGGGIGDVAAWLTRHRSWRQSDTCSSWRRRASRGRCGSSATLTLPRRTNKGGGRAVVGHVHYTGRFYTDIAAFGGGPRGGCRATGPARWGEASAWVVVAGCWNLVCVVDSNMFIRCASR
jgi:hypothetical protein